MMLCILKRFLLLLLRLLSLFVRLVCLPHHWRRNGGELEDDIVYHILFHGAVLLLCQALYLSLLSVLIQEQNLDLQCCPC